MPSRNTLILFAAILLIIGGLIGYGLSANKDNEELARLQNEQATQPPAQTADEVVETPAPSTNEWKTYTNTQHTYTLKHPANLPAGATAPNSVLGTATTPVTGVYIGPLVFVHPTTTQLRQAAQKYFDTYFNESPVNINSQDGPSIACNSERIANPDADIAFVRCTGEGGPAMYAIIKADNLLIFMDGYSRGFEGNSSSEQPITETTTKAILASFERIK